MFVKERKENAGLALVLDTEENDAHRQLKQMLPCCFFLGQFI